MILKCVSNLTFKNKCTLDIKKVRVAQWESRDSEKLDEPGGRGQNHIVPSWDYSRT